MLEVPLGDYPRWRTVQVASAWVEQEQVDVLHAHGGGAHALGAIVGALVGVRLGATAIPAHLASGVLGSERIKVLASQYYEVVTARGVTPES